MHVEVHDQATDQQIGQRVGAQQGDGEQGVAAAVCGLGAPVFAVGPAPFAEGEPDQHQ